MKKLGGYFCFKKTRIDGKTKGKMFGGFREIAYLCGYNALCVADMTEKKTSGNAWFLKKMLKARIQN